MILEAARHALLLVVGAAIALPVLAGEADHEPDDSHENGAPFFGEVKDIRGMQPIESALVRFQVKGTMRFLISQSDSEGQFRRHGLGPDVDPEAIEITCEKAGFRTIDVLRRRMSGDKHAPIEVECLMERQR